MNIVISPSRTYVAACSTWDGSKHFFKKFTLPNLQKVLGEDKNDTMVATWYYLNVLDTVIVIKGCFSIEDFTDLSDVQTDQQQQEPQADGQAQTGDANHQPITTVYDKVVKVTEDIPTMKFARCRNCSNCMKCRN